MDRSLAYLALVADSDRLLQHLSQWQYVGPHESVGSVLHRTVERLGVCPVAVQRAIEGLRINTSQPIGRLRRTELIQLVRAIHRHWRRQPEPRQPAASMM
jgi:hypothetical protein